MSKRKKQMERDISLLHRMSAAVAEMLGDDPETSAAGSTIVVDGETYRWNLTISHVPNDDLKEDTNIGEKE